MRLVAGIIGHEKEKEEVETIILRETPESRQKREKLDAQREYDLAHEDDLSKSDLYKGK